jgi:hypothetical protein
MLARGELHFLRPCVATFAASDVGMDSRPDLQTDHAIDNRDSELSAPVCAKRAIQWCAARGSGFAGWSVTRFAKPPLVVWRRYGFLFA